MPQLPSPGCHRAVAAAFARRVRPSSPPAPAAEIRPSTPLRWSRLATEPVPAPALAPVCPKCSRSLRSLSPASCTVLRLLRNQASHQAPRPAAPPPKRSMSPHQPRLGVQLGLPGALAGIALLAPRQPPLTLPCRPPPGRPATGNPEMSHPHTSHPDTAPQGTLHSDMARHRAATPTVVNSYSIPPDTLCSRHRTRAQPSAEAQPPVRPAPATVGQARPIRGPVDRS